MTKKSIMREKRMNMKGMRREVEREREGRRACLHYIMQANLKTRVH